MTLPPNDHSGPLALAPGKRNQGARPRADKVPKEQSPHFYGGMILWKECLGV